jgi:putative inorganic carbon (HCO3(-)) transporter
LWLLAAAVALAGSLLLLLSQSRAGWLGGAAGLAALAWLSWARRQGWARSQRRRWLFLSGAAGLSFAAVLPLAYRWAAARATLGMTGMLETVAFRFEVWRYALEAIADFPLTGTGLGAFRRVVLRLYPITAFPNPDVAHAHNVFLQLALDIGLPGLAAYLALLSTAAVVGWQWLRRAPDDRPVLAAGVLATLLAFHVFGLADTISLGAKPGLLFWWLLGLLATADHRCKQGELEKGRPVPLPQ